jgi:hypothetical protein
MQDDQKRNTNDGVTSADMNRQTHFTYYFTYLLTVDASRTYLPWFTREIVPFLRSSILHVFHRYITKKGMGQKLEKVPE